jgi:hypothetical protein
MTISIRPRHLLTLFLTSLTLSAHAAESFNLKISDLLQSEAVQKAMDPGVKLYWGNEATPTDIECELDKKSASVTLRAFMANRK